MKKLLKLLIPFMFPNVKILFWYRMSRWFDSNQLSKIALFIESFIQWNYSCAISCKANIHESLKLPHPIGVVIGAFVQIDSNVTIYQNVTIGRKINTNELCPRIKQGTVIYANSILLGDIVIDEATLIGACSLVIESTEKNSVYFGCPASKVR